MGICLCVLGQRIVVVSGWLVPLGKKTFIFLRMESSTHDLSEGRKCLTQRNVSLSRARRRLQHSTFLQVIELCVRGRGGH